ncbi:quinone oxidoreductase [Alsobacter metallidurans]|uniref:Quinone oxidoreductase n=1 Tax=Alsobacter metallidurans TaxID=340221 RepID=A0A917I7K0_9HYPH|nr:quinone oxidoreductase [Alsobacter metallidurans]GGH19699.1 quinone oxidoreductase [Alsobacter metallidurans]
MVKAIRVHKVGGPEALSYEDVELPAAGPGEVRVKHRAIGLNYIDVYDRSGVYPAQTPFIPGSEASGDVVAVGEGVTEFKVGDRVAYTARLGGYAEERNVAAKVLVKLPDAIDYETGAGMMLKGLTAQYLLRRTYKVQKGDTILFHAAAGGVGMIACQWANHLGATVIGTVGSADKAKLAKDNGCHHTILYRDEDFVARVAEITGGKKCQVVYDGVGKQTFPGSLDCLRPLGMFVSFGSSSGAIEAFNIGILAQKGSLFATRPTLFTYTAERADLLAMCDDLFAVIASGAVKIPVTQRFALKDAAEAHRALEGRDTTGVTILTP